DASLNLNFEMKNLTKYRGQDIRMTCDITGNPTPNYYWFRNNVSLANFTDSKRFTILRESYGSRLKIINAQASDSGVYTCKAYNIEGSKETSAVLTVMNASPPPSAGGKGGNDDDDDIGITKDKGDGDFNGRYDKNSLSGHVGDVDDNRKNSEGFCLVYRGSTCSRFVGNMSIYVKSVNDLSDLEESMIAAFALIGGVSPTQMSKKCEPFGIKSMCYFAFPLCDTKTKSPAKARQICRDECERLESDICKDEYLMAKKTSVFTDKKILPICNELKESGTAEGDNCIRIGVNSGVRDSGMEENCYTGNGKNYQGLMSVSNSGLLCNKWTSTSHSELGDHNYCRNPGSGSEDKPWCYTSAGKETCNIPICKHSQHTQGIGEASEDSNKLMYILIPSLTVPLALGILLALICFCQKSHITRSSRPNKQSQPVEMSPLNPKAVSRVREFPMQNIRFLQELGEGAFGKVYKGELVGLYSESSVSKVAVKTLKENALPKVQNDFRREIDLMAELRHPNIVCLLGVSMKKEPMCMLFEYMALGDLHEYLLSHSPHSDVTSAEDDSGAGAGHILEYAEMLHISTQVSAGMEYLASHHFVHRDLAARNILVADGLSVKISDFGLSRDVYSSDYYRVQSKALLPVRWMPPEAILYGKFTTDSDVWAFGVVLWEIFSYGLQPYYGFSNQEVIEMIRSRQILACPEECPARIYGLMVECWHEMPGRRPAFREIHNRLRSWLVEVTATAPWTLSQSQSGHSSSTHQSNQSQPSHHSSTGPSNTTAVTGLTGSSNTSEPSPGGQILYNPQYMPYNNHGTLSPPLPYNIVPQQQQQQHQQQQHQMLPANGANSMHLQQQYKVNLYNGQTGNYYVQYPGGQPAVLNLQSGQIQVPRNTAQSPAPAGGPNGASTIGNAPTKVSPAGSVASSKSSNSASSTNNLGVGVAPRPGMVHAGQNTNNSASQPMNSNYKHLYSGGNSNISTQPPVSIAECNVFNNFPPNGYQDQQRTSNI
ncbi:tyrosine-protein kinase transmembrane receptor ROR1-like isoform X1, partial [Biomphalaria glabrata]